MNMTEVDREGWVKPNPLSDPKSLEHQFRSRRFAHVKALMEECLARKDRIEILDLGGTESYWSIAGDYLARLGDRVSITLVNNETPPPVAGSQFSSVEGDACSPALFADRRFDLVHSNSVIEHVGEVHKMEAFAGNVRRLADRYFVQTPNYWFPLEPHFRIVGFQWLPIAVRVALMRRYNLGFFPKAESPEEAWDNVREIRLLDRTMMKRLFPDAAIEIEKVYGLPKSIMAVARPSSSH